MATRKVEDVLYSPLPDSEQGPCATLHWIALVFAMLFPGVMAWVYFVALAQPVPGEGKPVGGAFPAYLVSKVLQFGFPLLWVWVFERQRLRPALPSFRGLAFGLGFGLAVAVAIFCIYYGLLGGSQLLAETPSKVKDKLILFHADTPSRYFLLALFIAGLHSLMEEYYWRWFVFGELRRRISVALAIYFSSLAFMLHHVVVLGVYFPGHFFTATIAFSFCIAIGGAVWAWLYQRTGTIYSSWVSHLLVDSAILVVGYDMVFSHAR